MVFPDIFAGCLVIAAILVMIMAAKGYTNIDIYYCSIVLSVPIVLLGYWLKASANSIDDARLAFCVLYLDSTILPVLMLFSLLKSLKINVASWIKVAAYGIASLHLFTIWMCKDNNLYYATFEIEKSPLGTITRITDGPLKITHYIFLTIVLAAMVTVLVISVIRKGKYSKRTIGIYSSFIIAAIAIYVLETLLRADFSILPVFYTLIDIYITLDYDYVHAHDIDCVVIDQQKIHSKRGYIAFDKRMRLLSYNEAAASFIPELETFKIDKTLVPDISRGEDPECTLNVLCKLLNDYKANGDGTCEFEKNDLTYRATVMDFYLKKSGHPAGLLIELQDVTAEHAYTNLIKEYGSSLKNEVNNQTDQIKNIQNKVVLGMATIIENRDMNTGGHVRRTSDIISIIVEEMQKQGRTDIDDKFADEVIRSAPMHDLGKISIDNKILCKPDKLTDEEYAIMKTHSAKSGEIVKAILSGVEDPHFVNTAFCLARFHHERWDGRGYPEGLMEDEIPLEARIMAVADVYDALVSKRCYKKPMSFEKAAEIMLDGMGTQFDPAMKPIFEGCREDLEAYYKGVNAEEARDEEN